MGKPLLLKIALLLLILCTASCWRSKNSCIERTWKLKKVEGYDSALDSVAASNDQYHSFLKNVIIEHKRHNSMHYGITWLFNSDSTFKIIFWDNDNETDDNKWRIGNDTLYLAIWHNNFYLKFMIKKLSKDSMILENSESGKSPTKLVFAAYKKKKK